MPSTNIGYSRKFSYNEDSSEFASPDSNIELNSLKNQIKSLNSIIDSLQQENLKLNKSCNLLHDKYINVSSLNNTENKDRKSESGKIKNLCSSLWFIYSMYEISSLMTMDILFPRQNCEQESYAEEGEEGLDQQWQRRRGGKG